MNPRIGDFVYAQKAKVRGECQGIYIRNNRDGTVVVRNPNGIYLCKGPEGLRIIPDRNIRFDKEFVEEVRKGLGLD